MLRSGIFSIVLLLVSGCVGGGDGSSGEILLLGGESSTLDEIVDDSVDSDGDGLTDIEETKCGTSDSLDDTDADGLTDFQECGIADCDPNNNDSDGDGTSDFKEVSKFGSCTLNNDFDEDGFENTNDCDDENAAVNLAAEEVFGDGIDSDCRPSRLLCTPDSGEPFSCGGEDGYGIRFQLRDVVGLLDYELSPGNIYCLKAELVEPPGGFTKDWAKESSVKLSILREHSSTNDKTARFAYELDGFPNTEETLSFMSGSPAFPECGPTVPANDSVPFKDNHVVEDLLFTAEDIDVDCDFSDEAVESFDSEENKYIIETMPNFVRFNNSTGIAMHIDVEMTGYVRSILPGNGFDLGHIFIDPVKHIGHCSFGE